MTNALTSITSHGMGRKMLPSKKAALTLAKDFGKDIPQGQGFTVALTPSVAMTNKKIGNARRVCLIGTPSSLSRFVREHC